MTKIHKKVDEKTVKTIETFDTPEPVVTKNDKAELQTELDHIPDRKDEIQEQLDAVNKREKELKEMLKIFE